MNGEQVARHQVAIVWLRRALRLADHPALSAAVAEADAVVPAFVLERRADAAWPDGAASRWWTGRSLEAFSASLKERGAGLVVREGDAAAVLSALAHECGATAVYCERRYEPDLAAADDRVAATLERAGGVLRAHNCSLLNEPDVPRTAAGGPFKVFTPYFNACSNLPLSDLPLRAPDRIPAPPVLPRGIDLEARTGALGGAPQNPGTYWQPGEAGALAHAAQFFSEAAADYETDRDRPDRFGTSRLSPHLAFGEIGPRQLLVEARELARRGGAHPAAAGARALVRQLYWREFAYHLLHHFPHTTECPLRPEFASFPWVDDAVGFEAWKAGHTGYPIVDAGMRELLATGWMHNRVRMIVASFLTKDLLIPWQHGAHYFWDRLVDADLANNTLGWQWVAGSGADAAPFFRVFNPVLQGEKYDPEGTYVRTWVPELSRLPNRWLHRPWEAPAAVLADAGVSLDETYPARIINHSEARTRALAAYASIRGDGASGRGRS